MKLSRQSWYWWLVGAGGMLLLAILVLVFWPLYQVTQRTNSTVPLRVGEAVVYVELAVTPEAKQQGLSGRARLAADEGMLFLYQQPGSYSFWMKDMKFPLDFVWISQDRVVQLHQNIRPPASATEPPVIVTPTKEVEAVLEVPAGWVERRAVEVGDPVELVQPPP